MKLGSVKENLNEEFPHLALRGRRSDRGHLVHAVPLRSVELGEGAMTIAELKAAVERAFEIGPYAYLSEGEESRGATLIAPGSVPWLSADDWPYDIVVSQLGKDVRIVAIYSPNPGQGAFSRLVTAIAKAGLRPVVVCPTNHMRAICERWGWKEQIVGSTFDDREDRLIPKRQWLKRRAA
jgi:hypothetical protein